MRTVSTPKLDAATTEKELETPTKVVQKAVKGKAETAMAEEGASKDRAQDVKTDVNNDMTDAASLAGEKVGNVMKSVPIAPVTAAGKTALAPGIVSPQKILESGNGASNKSTAPKAMQPAAKSMPTTQASSAKAAPVSPTKPEQGKSDPKRKQPPGKLDISAAVQQQSRARSSSTKSADTAEQAKEKPDAAPQSAATKSPHAASPVVKSVPKTLRVVATPKAETPPTGVTTPKEPGAPIPSTVTARVPSRKPSVASINPPGTPSSEQVSISDNLSMASTSQSRANSPPPAAASKVGSAPVKKTKGQLKKERQERAKAIEEEKGKVEEPVAPKTVVEEPAQEAIVSRKKKTKKEKEPKPPKPKAPAPEKAPAAPAKVEDSTPTASRPATPQATTPPVPAKAEHVIEQVKTSKSSTPTAVPPVLHSPGEPSPPPTPTLSAAQLIAELKATAPEIQKCIDSLFRTPASPHYKSNQPITAKDLERFKKDFHIDLTPAELSSLLKGKVPAIRYGGDDGRIWDRGMVSPTGAHLRALTAELEQRFLELEKAIEDLPEELRYRPAKPQNETRFPSLDLEALRRQFEGSVGGRGVSVMEQMVQDAGAMKKGAFMVDEAARYVNEFVMPPATPPPSTNSMATGKAQQFAGLAADVSGITQGANPEITERQLNEARRVAEERDVALKKVVKKNRKAMGLA